MSTPESAQRLDFLLRESDSVASFLKACVCKANWGTGNITIFELENHYIQWCENNGLTPLAGVAAKSALRAAVSEQFQTPLSNSIKRGENNCRGYRGLQFIEDKNVCDTLILSPAARKILEKQRLMKLGVAQDDVADCLTKMKWDTSGTEKQTPAGAMMSSLKQGELF